MNRPNKRRRPAFQFDSSSDDDSDNESSYDASNDSDIEAEESETENEAAAVFSEQPLWKPGSPQFVPRKAIPSFKEPETSIDENHTITEVFFKLFPKSMFMWIAQCTNERLAISNEVTGKNIPPTDWHEIMVVVGCMLVMSYNRVPHMYMYWSGNKSVRNDTIANAISRDRFMLLHSKLYCNTPTKPTEAKKTYYMTAVVECLKKTFNQYRSEAVYQSIDETMVKCKARTTMKQRMPQKPEKNGIKNWTRADATSGYVYDFNVYEGAEKGAADGTLGERVRIDSILLNV
ncbi:hypothetical protein HA402_001182 [Bradysia odoriphaga]|nr:hypothetical protein HA402_001182 [Bradysia odoriphaga]